MLLMYKVANPVAGAFRTRCYPDSNCELSIALRAQLNPTVMLAIAKLLKGPLHSNHKVKAAEVEHLLAANL